MVDSRPMGESPPSRMTLDRIAEFVAHMLGLGRAQAPVAIGGWRGDAAAEGIQQLLRHRVRRHADADAVLAAGDDVVDVVGFGQNQRQGPGPEFGGQLLPRPAAPMDTQRCR